MSHSPAVSAASDDLTRCSGKDIRFLRPHFERKNGAQTICPLAFVDCFTVNHLIGTHYLRFFQGAFLPASSTSMRTGTNELWESAHTKDGFLSKMIQRNRRSASK